MWRWPTRADWTAPNLNALRVVRAYKWAYIVAIVWGSISIDIEELLVSLPQFPHAYYGIRFAAA